MWRIFAGSLGLWDTLHRVGREVIAVGGRRLVAMMAIASGYLLQHLEHLAPLHQLLHLQQMKHL